MLSSRTAILMVIEMADCSLANSASLMRDLDRVMSLICGRRELADKLMRRNSPSKVHVSDGTIYLKTETGTRETIDAATDNAMFQ
jgi:hypothetical protein